MRVPASSRFRLREATAPEHERVDSAFAAYRLDRRDDYRAFLTAQADAFLPVEQAIDAADPSPVLPDWPQRRRGALLTADLADLGVTVVPGEAPVIEGTAAMLGAIYVLEGSRLGGRLLARSVGDGLPTRFVGADDAGRWRAFVDALDEHLVSDDDVVAALEAARAVFARFETSARRHQEDALP